MTHQRQTIRDKIVSLLGAAGISGVSSSDVFSNRVLPEQSENLPIINVVTGGEQATVDQFCDGKSLRELTVELTVRAKTATHESIDDALDAIADGVETCFRTNTTLDQTAIDNVLVSTTAPEIDAGAEYTIGTLTMTYLVQYRF